MYSVETIYRKEDPMASKESVIRLFEAMLVPVELEKLRDNSIANAEAAAGDDNMKLAAVELVRRNTEDWPDKALNLLVTAYAEELSDEDCEKFIAFLDNPIFRSMVNMLTAASMRAESFWEWRIEQIELEAGLPPESPAPPGYMMN